MTRDISRIAGRIAGRIAAAGGASGIASGFVPALAWMLLLCGAAARAETPAAYLPPEPVVREMIAGAPDVMVAQARLDATLARMQGVRAGSAETVIRATGQGRQVREPSERYAEGQIAVERQLRLWGKADADAELADATTEAARVAVNEARHQASRQILSLWFAVVRAGQARDAAQVNASAASDLAALTARRVQLGDASRLDGELAAADDARMRAALATATAAEQAAKAELLARFPGLIPPTLADGIGLPAPQQEPPDRLRTAYIDESHEYRLAVAEERQAMRQARRSDLERHPDPTVGVFVTVERGGAERIMGVSIAMPLGSAYRQSAATAAVADAQAAVRQRLGVALRLGAEFDVLYRTVQGKREVAQAQAEAAGLQASASERAMRAYGAGESGLVELLAARRSLADALLAERLSRVDVLEADSRLQLDLHRLWDFDH